MTIHAALRFFTEEATHRSYPVVDAEGRLVGLASRSDALRWKAGAFDENTTLTETLSDASQTTAYPDTPCGVIADLIVETGVARVPIVDRETHKVVGILSRQALLKARKEPRTRQEARRRGKE